jgi:putative addiction module CopG family antidote
MSSNLSPQNESYIQGKIASGLFSSRDEAVEAGIEMLRKRDELSSIVQESRRQLDSGEFTEYDDESLTERFDALKQRAQQKGQTDS